MRKVILYISMSLDGFIATEDDDLSWLSKVEKPGEDYGYGAFTANIDTYIVGRKTYDKVVEMVGTFPQANDYDCYIITRQEIPNTENLTFYNGDIVELIQQIREREGKHIYCDGGGQIVKLLMDNDLIDEYIVSIIPVILGSGKRLFIGNTPSREIKLISEKRFETGLVQVAYARNREGE
ncbi:dihydrofolate reductase family protein [bacterium]|nr:dihydrofolate reductase family protein [bacterium]